MAKGNDAKTALLKRFQTAVGKDYIGVDSSGKKFYFWSSENGEQMQVYIQLTVPKTPLVCEGGGDLDFDGDSAPAVTQKVEMGEDEQATLDRLMSELNL